MAQDRQERAQPRIRLAAETDYGRIENLWTDLYAHHRELGMTMAPGREQFGAWVASMKPFHGRFSCLFIADTPEEVAGFVAGRVRTAPPYLGGQQIGYIGEVYVSPQWQGQGIGARLVRETCAWFQEQGIQRVDLQVMARNEEALRFYRKLGWEEESIQIRWHAATPADEEAKESLK